MRKPELLRSSIALPLLLAVLWHEAGAQTAEAAGQVPVTVIVTAPRSPILASYETVEMRIKRYVEFRSTETRPTCVDSQFLKKLDNRFFCAREHIAAKDRTMKQGIEAFEEQDYTTARAQFEQAFSKLGNHDAALILAKMNLDGLGAAKNTYQGVKWLKEVAWDRFDPWKDWRYLNPNTLDPNSARIESTMMLARIYDYGNGAARDWKEAERWYSRAAEFGYVPALEIIGEAYLSGQGPAKSVAKAIRYFKEAAEEGNSAASYKLGKLYHAGTDGVPRDLMLAGAYFDMAAKAGHPGAMFEAGRMYQTGEGVGANLEMAVAYYRVAAEQGNAEAKSALGALAGYGPADEALKSVAPAVDLDNPAAMADTNQQEEPARPQAAEEDAVRLADSEPDRRDPSQFTVVRVTGVRAVPWKSYRAMRAAVAAFEKNRALAPDAVFRFAVLAPVGKTLPPNFKLRVLTKDGREFPIKLENGELFQLPVLPDPEVEADLVSNMKGGPLRIGLLVHTRTVAPERERLGDVRLRSLINEAIAEVDNPRDDDARCLTQKARRNGCRPDRFVMWHKPRAPASEAKIVDGERVESLQTNDDPNYPAFRIPLDSGYWRNDAIIAFDFKQPLRPVKLSEVAIYSARD